MKSTVYNLIILDESGSMGGVRNQTISGCNETINTIRAAQKQYADTQDHRVSIFAFQSGGELESRYLFKNVPVDEVRHITKDDYMPDGCTPLYDAVGGTLTDLKAVIGNEKFAVGSVTIITDGMENTSRHYSLNQVARMISALKEKGWNFTFIGANIDVEATARSLKIDNALEFTQDEQGTKEMFAKENRSRRSWMERTKDVMLCMSAMMDSDECGECDINEEYSKRMSDVSKGYFEEEQPEKK